MTLRRYRTFAWLEEGWRDLRFAVRSLARMPGFTSIALLVAAIGVFGVMSYSVQQRTQEMGVRMALGAQASNLRNMVIGQSILLALLRVAVGLGGAFWLTRFEVTLITPLTMQNIHPTGN